MSIKIDLKIFLFALVFLLTNQIEIYVILMLFALIHEMAHLLTGLCLGFKPMSIGINPCGFQIEFQTNLQDYNKQIKNANELCIKKIIIALAGPAINLVMAIFLSTQLEWGPNIVNMIYANLLIAIFNLLPIYPLDGGRILLGVLHLKYGLQKAYKLNYQISNIIIIILTIIGSIAILYIHNIGILIILAYLWFLVIKNNKLYQLKEKIYRAVDDVDVKKYDYTQKTMIQKL